MADGRDIALMAHLMRRAGFGADRGEIETLAEQGYEETVDQLLHPESQPALDQTLFYRYHPGAELGNFNEQASLNWMHRFRNTRRPLQEKMALFWHHVFATGSDKVGSALDMSIQVELFRTHGMGSFRNLLVELARNPAMVYWLDNQENHKRAPNENWGRELLELFSMGVGNYTEKDVYECARAFTGWSIGRKLGYMAWTGLDWQFTYRPEDHDGGEKSFLGHSGRFGGEDVIDIIVEQPACHAFIARHLYNFFVADEPEVPRWPSEPPRDPAAVRLLADAFADSDCEIRSVLRTLFDSDFFKEALYCKIKSPVEVVIGTLKLTGDLEGPDPRWGTLYSYPQGMGQELLNPPTVEGWHTGREWINSGFLIDRVNFVADRVGDTSLPGVRAIVERVRSGVGGNGGRVEPDAVVDGCLDLMGPLAVEEETYAELVAHLSAAGPITIGNGVDAEFSRRVAGVLALIAGTVEYQSG